MNKQNILFFLISFSSIYASDNASLSIFEELPLEKQQEIIVHLPVHDIWNIRAVSPYFKNLVNTCTGINFLQKFVQEEYPYIKVEDEVFRSFLKKTYNIKNFFWKAENPLVYLENNLSVEDKTDTYTKYRIVIPEYIKELREHSQYEQEIEKIESKRIIECHNHSFCENIEYDANTIFYGSLYILNKFDKQINPFYKYMIKDKSNNFYIKNRLLYFYKKNQKTDEELISIISEYKPLYTKKFLEVAIKKSSLSVISFLTQNMSYISNDIVEYAAKYSPEALQFFIEEKRVKPGRVCNEFGHTPLLVAAIVNDLDVIKYLVEKDAMLLGVKDAYGYGVFDYACKNFNVSLLDIIKENNPSAFKNINYNLQQAIDIIQKNNIAAKKSYDFLHYYFEYIFPNLPESKIEENKVAIVNYFKALISNTLILQSNLVMEFIDLFYDYHFDAICATFNAEKQSKEYDAIIENIYSSVFPGNGIEIIYKLIQFKSFGTQKQRDKLFIHACHQKNYTILEGLLTDGKPLDIDSVRALHGYYDKYSPLTLAVTMDNLELCSFLLDRGADMCYSYREYNYSDNDSDKDFKTIFDYICKQCKSDKYKFLNLLLEKNFKKDYSDALLIAVNRSDIRLISYLLEKGFDPKKTNNSGQNLLSVYMHKKGWIDTAIVSILLKHSVDFEQDFFCMISEMEKERFMNIVSLFLEHGADINALSSAGSTVLIEIINRKKYNDLKNLITFLFEKGAFVSIKNSDGKTVIDIFKEKFAQILQFLDQDGIPSIDQVAELVRKNLEARKQEKAQRKVIFEVYDLLSRKAEEEKNSSEIMNKLDEKNKIPVTTKVTGGAISILKNRCTWGVIGVIASLTAFYFAKDLFFYKEGVAEEGL